MFAIPLSESSSTTISDLYGNAPYFAFIDPVTGEITVSKNDGCGDGIETAKFVKKRGATLTIFYHMGEGVFKNLIKDEIKVFSSMKKYLSIDEIYKNFLEDRSVVVTKENSSELLDSGSSGCTCGCKD